MFSKKANSSLQKSFFFLGYLALAGFLIYVSFSIFNNITDGSAESKIASDLALTIQSLALHEGDMFIVYSPNVDSFSAQISPLGSDDSNSNFANGANIFVFGPTGESESKAFLPSHISIESADWNDISTLPIQKKGPVISFAQPSFDELRGLCNRMPGTLENGVKILKANNDPNQLSSVEKALENRLKNSDMYDLNSDLTLKVVFDNDDQGNILHGSDISERFGCFLDVYFSDFVESGDNNYDNISRVRGSNNNLVVINMPNRQEFDGNSQNQEKFLSAVEEVVGEMIR